MMAVSDAGLVHCWELPYFFQYLPMASSLAIPYVVFYLSIVVQAEVIYADANKEF